MKKNKKPKEDIALKLAKKHTDDIALLENLFIQTTKEIKENQNKFILQSIYDT